MALDVSELENGISYWRDRTGWPKDFHNLDYAIWATNNPHGQFDLAWWDPFLKSLKGWYAIRPMSGEEITKRAQERFGLLGRIWLDAVEPLTEQDITGVSWEQIESFPQLVAEIKNVESPVFTSKFCHFLAPKIFPVTDNEAMGLPRSVYRDHYDLVESEWTNTDDGTKIQLQSRMIECIGVSPTPEFPMVNKIVELSLIGRYQAGR